MEPTYLIFWIAVAIIAVTIFAIFGREMILNLIAVNVGVTP